MSDCSLSRLIAASTRFRLTLLLVSGLLSTLLLNSAQAQQFGDQKVIGKVEAPRSVYAQDLDGDRDADVLSAATGDDMIAWHENLGGGEFSDRKVITTNARAALSVYAQDLDEDGDADVLSASDNDHKIAWYENLGGGEFSGQKVITTSADRAQSVYAQDLDEDGDADVLSASVDDKKVAWYENLGGGEFSDQKVITTSADGANSVYASDLDGDGDADVLSASRRDDKIAWYENLGGGEFSDQKVITTNAWWATSVHARDLDGDGDADILSASYNDDKIAWYENLGGGEFSDQKVITTSTNRPHSVHARDLDGDGDADILSAASGKIIAWHENLGGGEFSDRKVIPTSTDGAYSVYTSDLDGDGTPDVLSASPNVDKIAWHENLGDGSAPPSPSALSVTPSDGEVHLTWSAGGDSSPEGYNVYRSTSSFSDISNATKMNGSLVSSTSYTDTGVSNGIEYFYRVTSVDSDGNESSPSSEVSATPMTPADWPAPSNTPALVLKVVTSGGASVREVVLRGKGATQNGNRYQISKTETVEEGFVSFDREDLKEYVKTTQIRLFDKQENLRGHQEFQYDKQFFDRGKSIDAILHVHGEEVLQPNLDQFPDLSSDWNYYIEGEHPVSMLIPPSRQIENVDQESPVLMVHGLSGIYPYWGYDPFQPNPDGTETSLVTQLSAPYDTWRFYYPKNQDVSKSSPLLSKALRRLQQVYYGTDEKIDVVAQSMGGLVTRHYIQSKTNQIGPSQKPYPSDLQYKGNIGKFIMMGTPNHGALSAYRPSERFVEGLGGTVFGKDPEAPAYRQLTPGSDFLSDLNDVSDPESLYPPSSTLVLAGTRNPPYEDGGVQPFLEIPNQDDGLVAVASASLLREGVPLAIGPYAHSTTLNEFGGVDIGDALLLTKDTGEIVLNFLDGYNPSSPNLGESVTGFWTGTTDLLGSPNEVVSPPSDFNDDDGILIASVEGDGTEELGVVTECQARATGSCSPQTPVFRLGGNAGMTPVPSAPRFFSSRNGIGFGFPAKKFQTAYVQKKILGGWGELKKTSISFGHLQTFRARIPLTSGEKLLAQSSSLLPPSENGGSEKATASGGFPASGKSETKAKSFRVGPSTDSLAFWLSRTDAGSLSDHGMRLVAPDGSVIDSTKAKSESGFGFTENPAVGSVIYFVRNPSSGRWTVQHDATKDARLSAPVKSAIDLKVSMPDSSFTTEESVPVTVSVSGQNTYQNTEISAQLRADDLNREGNTKLGPVELIEAGPATYEGEFSPSYVGSHSVAVDFSARVNGEPVLRRAVETVVVRGDSTNTVPDPPSPPTDLSAQGDKTGNVALSWSAPSGPVDGYRIYRDTIPAPVRQVESVSPEQTDYTDASVQGGQTYYYRITTVGAEGVESDFSEEISIFSESSSLSAKAKFYPSGISLADVSNGSSEWGDYDGDGDQDLLITGAGDDGPVAMIYENDGTEMLSPTETSLTGVRESSSDWGDFNNDGLVDLVLTGVDSSGSPTARIYENQGGGDFTTVGADLTGVKKGASEWGDFDGDGDLDLVITGIDGSGNRTANYYENQGGGNFNSKSMGLKPSSQGSIDSGDIDGDGDIDLITTGLNESSETATRLYEYVNGSEFEIKNEGIKDVFTGSSNIIDFDGDGYLDIVVSGRRKNSKYFLYPHTSSYKNDGSGNFTSVDLGFEDFALGDSEWRDLEMDNDLDVVITGITPSGAWTRVYRNNNGQFESLGLDLFGSTGSVGMGDSNNDGDIDIIVTSTFGESDTRLFTNRRNQKPPSIPPRFTGIFSYDALAAGDTLKKTIEYGDPDGDSISVGLNDPPSNAEIIHIGSGISQFKFTPTESKADKEFDITVEGSDGNGKSKAVNFTIGVSARFEEMQLNTGDLGGNSSDWGDFDSDGDIDLIMTSIDSGDRGETVLYENDGEGDLASVDVGLPDLAIGASKWQDYDGDGDLDLALSGRRTEEGTRLSAIYENLGGNEFTKIDSGIKDLDFSSMDWGDIDSDGDYDLVITGRPDLQESYSAVYENTKQGFEKVDTGIINVWEGDSEWGDINNDGKLDLIITGSGTNSDGIHNQTTQIYENYSTGGNISFDKVNTGVVDVGSGSSVALGNINNNKYLDVAISGNAGGPVDENPKTIIYRNEGGFSFVPFDTLSGVERNASLDWGDADGDGDLDLIVAGAESQKEITNIYENRGQNGFSALGPRLTSVGFNWSTSSWGDSDDDGDLDLLVAGNRASHPGTEDLLSVYENKTNNQNFPPNPPNNTDVSHDGGFFNLSWSPSTDRKSSLGDSTPESSLTYNVFIREASSEAFLFSPQASVDGSNEGRRKVVDRGNVGHHTELELSGVRTGVTYEWGVQTLDKNFAGSEFATGSTFALPPSNLQATTSKGRISLSWPAVDAEDVQRYRIFRSATPIDTRDPSDLTPIDSVSAPLTSYSDTSLAAGATYYYRISAINGSGYETMLSSSARALAAELVASDSAQVNSDGTISLEDSIGASTRFSGVSSSGMVFAQRFSGKPADTSGNTGQNIGSERLILEARKGLAFDSAEVQVGVDAISGISNPSTVTLYKRDTVGVGAFEAIETKVDSNGTPEITDDTLKAEMASLSELIVASDDPSNPLPVELSSLNATLDGQDVVRLTWTTASETGNAGFRVQRKIGEKGTGTWTTVGSVEGGGTTTDSKSYRYVDEDLPYEADRLTYRLKQVDTDGSTSYSKEVTVSREVKEAELLGTYPNPAQTRATLRYAVPERQDVKIHLYDILGRRVQTVVDGEREGRHKRQVNLSGLSSGVYFLRLQAEGATKTQKLTVLR